jgi:hypothetical protein
MVLVGAVCLAGCGTAGGLGASSAGAPASIRAVNVARHSVPLEDIVFDTFDGGFMRLSDASLALRRSLIDRIRPVYRPRFGDARSLPWLDDRDLVVGYVSRSAAYAVPIKVLNLRELINAQIDGVPLLVSYCPLCASAVVFNRRLGPATLVFGNTSALYQSDLVMFDRQTGSYWFQAGGEAIVGDLTGRRLTPRPSTITSWRRWKRLHPLTQLLNGDGAETFGAEYASDDFAGYAARVNAHRFAFPVARGRIDARLRAGEVVVTAEAGSAVKAFAPRLIGDAAVNDTVGTTPVVVFSHADGTAAIFLPTGAGRRLTFQRAAGRYVDHQTHTTWNDAGVAVAGSLRGSRLRPVPGERGFWFSVAIAHPHIALYE